GILGEEAKNLRREVSDEVGDYAQKKVQSMKEPAVREMEKEESEMPATQSEPRFPQMKGEPSARPIAGAGGTLGIAGVLPIQVNVPMTGVPQAFRQSLPEPNKGSTLYFVYMSREFMTVLLAGVAALLGFALFRRRATISQIGSRVSKRLPLMAPAAGFFVSL